MDLRDLHIDGLYEKLFGSIHFGYNWTHVTVAVSTAIFIYSRVLNVRWSTHNLTWRTREKIEVHFSLY